MSRKTVAFAIAVGLLGLTVAACAQKGVEAPTEEGVCYHVVLAEDGKSAPQINVVARDQPQIEFCAARLEEMRLRFLRMGGSNQEIAGAYQGRFIFVDREGVKIGKSLNGSRFFAMARTGDGRLAIPGAIQRDETGRPIAIAAPQPETK